MTYEKIWRKTLNPDEKVKYEFSVGTRYRTVFLVFWIILGIVVIVPTAFISRDAALSFLLVLVMPFIFYYGFYLKVANAYAFTDRRVLIHRGWLSTRTVSVDYDKITDVTVIEPIIEKILTKTGHLAVNTAGTEKQEVFLSHIGDPYEVKKKLDELRK